MRNGICPMCSSTTVYTQSEGISFGDGSGIFIRTSSMTHVSKSISYVCTTCGFSAIFVEDAAKLKQVAEKWTLVRPSP